MWKKKEEEKKKKNEYAPFYTILSLNDPYENLSNQSQVDQRIASHERV